MPRQIIIPAPVELESWLATDAGDATKSSPFAFTFLGRLDKGKGVDDLLRAFAGLCEDPEINGRSDLKLKIIGDGPKKNELLALCRKLKIEAKVEWTGWKTGEELAHEIKQSGLFVVPSAIEEPLGVVVLELMAAGKSLIVPFYGGATEYAGDACLTFINGSVESLADAMKKAYLNPELQEQLSTLALERAKLFRPEIGMREYRDLFEKLVAKMAERN